MRTIDFAQCEIRTPTGPDRVGLYEFLAQQFPTDGPLFLEILSRGASLYTWVPYTLYRGPQILGNVSLMPMRVWLDGRFRELVGIASVATAPEFRGCGVAKHLLEHCLAMVDARRRPCALFTGLPRVYQGIGFRSIEQPYVGAPAERIARDDGTGAIEAHERLSESLLAELSAVFGRCPDYTGKVERDPDYWPFYQTLFNPFPQSRIGLCRRGNALGGYVRWEPEPDRLLVSELCADPNETEALETLFRCVVREARQAGLAWITLALPADHFARAWLERRGTTLAPEPPGALREAFMVRPAKGESLGRWSELQWSLADKF